MAKCLYNGLEFPELPQWDENEYPRAYLYLTGTETRWGTLVLVPAGAEISYVDGSEAILFLTSYYKCYSARSADDQWDDDGIIETSGSVYIIKPMVEFPDSYTNVQWSNFPIYTKDGYLLLAASDPVPIEDPEEPVEPEEPTKPAFDLRSFLSMLAAGLVCKDTLAQKEKEPVAYLYNGVRLPKLPEWDRGEYPYAHILWMREYAGTEYEYLLSVHTHPLVFVTSVTGNGIVRENALCYRPVTEVRRDYMFWLGDGKWEDEPGAMSETRYSAGNEAVMACEGSEVELVWTSTNIFKEDGKTLYFAASDPIPVYE